MKNNYEISNTTKVIGNGAFGKVFKSFNRHDPTIKVAIKVLDKNKLHGQMDMIMNEIEILNTLDHPNIVNYYETYDD